MNQQTHFDSKYYNGIQRNESYFSVITKSECNDFV